MATDACDKLKEDEWLSYSRLLGDQNCLGQLRGLELTALPLNIKDYPRRLLELVSGTDIWSRHVFYVPFSGEFRHCLLQSSLQVTHQEHDCRRRQQQQQLQQ